MCVGTGDSEGREGEHAHDQRVVNAKTIPEPPLPAIRYYHEDKAIWPVAQSNLVETFIPSVDVVGPSMAVCPVNLTLNCSFSPFKKRAPSVTEGDTVVVLRKNHVGFDRTFDVLPWSGTGAVNIAGDRDCARSHHFSALWRAFLLPILQIPHRILG